MRIVPRSFYARNTVTVAKELLGKILVREIDGKIVSGMIVETEAYKYKEDPASHAFGGKTDRNRAMFEKVGNAYVYFTYGMHYCVNAVARDPSVESGAVLIRSLVPNNGIEFMMKQRKTNQISNLANGPAKLTQALKITKEQYGVDLTKKPSLYIIEMQNANNYSVESRPRIGIKKATDKLWNFRISDHNLR